MWWGGWGIGPRYLLPALPFAAIAVAVALDASRALRRIGVVFALWSLVVTWGVTLAEQSFPPDTMFNPLFEYALPNWMNGNIARNFGTLLGFKGAFSLIPLGFGLIVLFLAWRKTNRNSSQSPFPESSSNISIHRDLTWIQR
jgi:branched-subunit amino acid ABC-type transport system permease component